MAPALGILGRVLVPDAIGAIVGWRTWRLRDTPAGLRLVSTIDEAAWPARRPLAASCRLAGHAAPEPGCSCGVHAASQLSLPLEYLPPHVRASSAFRTPAILGYDRVILIGHVSLWGRVVECEWGWRGELAYPAELCVPERVTHYRRHGDLLGILDSAGIAESLANAYGVPVAVIASARPDDLRSRAAA